MFAISPEAPDKGTQQMAGAPASTYQHRNDVTHPLDLKPLQHGQHRSRPATYFIIRPSLRQIKSGADARRR